MIITGVLRGPWTVFLAEVQKHVMGSFLHYLQVLGAEESVGLGETHVFHELTDRTLYPVWAAEPYGFLPTLYNFLMIWTD